MKDCIVVGGGLCGLFSAILLADKCDSVTLIESAENCGGLLKSVTDNNNVVYDQGTHIPNTTGHQAIDDILFGDATFIKENWLTINDLPSGSFFNGHWNLANQSVDIRHLPEQNYKQAVFELVSQDQPSDAENIEDYLRETLGNTITDKVSLPIVAKLYGNNVDAHQLQRQSSVNYFGITRVLALGEESSKALKSSAVFDNKLSFHNQEDYDAQLRQQNISKPTYYYPKNGQGIEFWVEHLLNQAKAKGVNIITSEFVSQIAHQQGKVTEITLGKSKQCLPCDLLYWSAPPVFGLKAAGMQASAHKAEFRTANIFYFNFDKPLTNQVAPFLWNWHPSHKTFRITLYPNLREQDNGHYNMSVEVVSAPEEANDITEEMILQEIQEMGLIAKGSTLTSSYRQTINNTFPVPTFDFAKATTENYLAFTEQFDNVIVSGRFSGKQWFHADVLTSAYQEISKRFPT